MRELVSAAREVALGAGALLRQAFGGIRQVSKKGSIDLVTDADHASERYILGELARRFPSHPIIAEESGMHAGDGPYRWIVDPLDGTVNFAHGLPHFCVLIAVQERRGDGFVTVGCASYDPLLNELFFAEGGQGAYLNDTRLHVSSTSRLIDGVFATGFSYDRLFLPNDNHAEFSRMNLLSQGARRHGCAGLDLAYVACGRLDGAWEYGLKPWDLAGGALLVTEAGGVITNVAGGPVDLAVGEYVASNPTLHPTLGAALRSAREAPVGSRQGLAPFLPPELAAKLPLS